MNEASVIISIISGVITIGSLLWVIVNWAIIKPIKRHLRHQQKMQKIQNDQEFCHLVSDMINNQY